MAPKFRLKLRSTKGTAGLPARGSRRGSPIQKRQHSLLISPNGKMISKEEDLKAVEAVLGKLSRRLEIRNVVYEKGNHRPHIHATIFDDKKTLFAKKYQYKGCYVGIRPMLSPEAYAVYLTKEEPEESVRFHKVLQRFSTYAF